MAKANSYILVNPYYDRLDPEFSVTHRISTNIDHFAKTMLPYLRTNVSFDKDWRALWHKAETAASHAIRKSVNTGASDPLPNRR